jgi:uncharacterized protein
METMSPSETKISRSVTWRRILDDRSLEQAQLVWTQSGPRITGTVLAIHEGGPLRVDYRIECDVEWRTRFVHVDQSRAGKRIELYLTQDRPGHWLKNTTEDGSLAGCTDVDLGITPSTNTLPIRRLAMPVGSRSEIHAARVCFPELDVSRAAQSYRRVSERGFIYESLQSGFKAPITMDKDGLVQEYGEVWKQVASSVATPEPSGFAAALTSDGPSPELADVADAFGWLVGRWSAEVLDFDANGKVRRGTGEWWFSWVLEGRAIQDVWIVPVRSERMEMSETPNRPSGPNKRYGTSIRWFDRSSRQWKIVWINPVSGTLNQLAGTRNENRIILDGIADGQRVRWSFNEIRPESFVWRGERRDDSGSWNLEAEFRLRRIA